MVEWRATFWDLAPLFSQHWIITLCLQCLYAVSHWINQMGSVRTECFFLYIQINSTWEWMKWFSGHFCAKTRQTGPGEPSEDGEMNQVTLPSSHIICNSNPGDLRPSTLSLGHRGSPHCNIIFTRKRRTNILFYWNLNSSAGDEPASSGVTKGSL